ncbi:MAG: hypothetical protein V4646_12370, partial [Pseudomonadota bacterium]
MNSSSVGIQSVSPAIALVTLQRQEKHNALDDALIDALIHAAETLRPDGHPNSPGYGHFKLPHL